MNISHKPPTIGRLWNSSKDLTTTKDRILAKAGICLTLGIEVLCHRSIYDKMMSIEREVGCCMASCPTVEPAEGDEQGGLQSMWTEHQK